MKTSQKGFAVIESLLILVIIAVVGGTGWYAWYSKSQTDKILAQSAKTSQSTTATNSIPRMPVDTIPPNTYTTQYCTSNTVHSDSIALGGGSFVSYNASLKYISFTVSGNTSPTTIGWCQTPKVLDANGRTISLNDLKSGESIIISTAWDGLRSIQIK